MKKEKKDKNLQQDLKRELEEQSPYLAALSRELPFYTPENYFQEAGERIQEAVSGNEPVTSFLPSPSDHPFQTPENYFDELPGVVQSRINKQEENISRVKHLRVNRRIIPRQVWFAAAAVAALIVTSLTWWSYQQQLPLSNSQMQAVVEDSEENNLLLSVSDVDEAVIVDLLLQDQAADAATIGSANQNDPSLMDVIEFDEQSINEI